MFKIKSKINKSKKSCYFTNDFANYGKTEKGLYRLEFYLNPFLGNSLYHVPLKLYQGKNKPMFKNLPLISLLLSPVYLAFELLFVILFPIGLILYCYFNGAYNAIKGGPDVSNVSIFLWVNTTFLYTLLGYLIVRSF